MYRIRNRVVQTMDMATMQAHSQYLSREFDVTCIVAGGQNLDIILYIFLCLDLLRYQGFIVQVSDLLDLER